MAPRPSFIVARLLRPCGLHSIIVDCPSWLGCPAAVPPLVPDQMLRGGVTNGRIGRIVGERIAVRPLADDDGTHTQHRPGITLRAQHVACSCSCSSAHDIMGGAVRRRMTNGCPVFPLLATSRSTSGSEQSARGCCHVSRPVCHRDVCQCVLAAPARRQRDVLETQTQV